MVVLRSLCLVLLVVCPGWVAAETTAESPIPPGLPENLAPGWYTTIMTGKGRIVARLLPEQAPQTVAHFAALAEGRLEWTDPVSGETRKGHFFDGSSVHRAMAGKRFEAGDPTGTGHGGPDLYVPDEVEGVVNFHVAGRLGMTRAPGRRFSAYQFFATASAQPFLTGRFPCFGTVVEGRDVILEITQAKTYSNGKPIEPIAIESVRIFALGDPPPLPEPEAYRPTRRKFEALKKPVE